MPLETNQWIELSAEQGHFFAHQLEAARQATFSSTAHEAGIVALNAARYSFEPGSESLQNAITWPDLYERNTMCIASGERARASGLASFVRVTKMSHSYAAEGVVTGLGYNRNLYGRQLTQQEDVLDIDPAQIGANFMIAALRETSELGALSLQKPSQGIVGVEGDTVARMYRSLSSLGSNLIVTGTMPERNFTNQTYDLASSLLKVTINGILRDQTSDAKGVLLYNANNKPRGALFESDNGIAAIYRTNGYPDSIALATVSRPRVDDHTLLVDQYSIQARAVSLDVMTLPVEAYNFPSLASALGSIKVTPKNIDTGIVANLDAAETQAVEQKIIRLLSMRINQTV